MPIRSFRLTNTTPKPLIMKRVRRDSLDHGVETAFFVFYLVVNRLSTSIGIFHSVAAFHCSIQLPAFPMIESHSIRLIDVIPKRIINLYLNKDKWEAEVKRDASRTKKLIIENKWNFAGRRNVSERNKTKSRIEFKRCLINSRYFHLRYSLFNECPVHAWLKVLVRFNINIKILHANKARVYLRCLLQARFGVVGRTPHIVCQFLWRMSSSLAR